MTTTFSRPVSRLAPRIASWGRDESAGFIGKAGGSGTLRPLVAGIVAAPLTQIDIGLQPASVAKGFRRSGLREVRRLARPLLHPGEGGCGKDFGSIIRKDGQSGDSNCGRTHFLALAAAGRSLSGGGKA
jgi:hypothetical protein